MKFIIINQRIQTSVKFSKKIQRAVILLPRIAILQNFGGIEELWKNFENLSYSLNFWQKSCRCGNNENIENDEVAFSTGCLS